MRGRLSVKQELEVARRKVYAQVFEVPARYFRLQAVLVFDFVHRVFVDSARTDSQKAVGALTAAERRNEAPARFGVVSLIGAPVFEVFGGLGKPVKIARNVFAYALSPAEIFAEKRKPRRVFQRPRRHEKAGVHRACHRVLVVEARAVAARMRG